MASNIGSGALVLTTDASGMQKGLNQAEKNLSASTKRMADTAKKGTNQIDEKFKNFSFTGAAGFGIGIGIGLVSNLLAEGAKSILDWVTGAKNFRLEMEKSAEAGKEIADLLSRRLGKEREFVDAVVDPKDKLAIINQQITQAEKEFKGLKSTMERFRTEREEWKDIWTSPTHFNVWLGGGREDNLKEAERKFAEAANKVEMYNTKLKDLREIRNRILDPSNNPALIGEINQLTETWTQQLIGLKKELSPLEQQILALERKGANSGMLKPLYDLKNQLENEQFKMNVAPISPVVKNSLDDFRIRAERELKQLFPRGKELDVQEQQLEEQKKAVAAINEVTKAIEEAGKFALGGI